MRRHLQQLLETAHRLYDHGVDAQCAESFRRARDVASALRDLPREIHARFWEGAVVHGDGRLHEALAIMAPTMTRRDVSLADGEVYRLATRYLRALAELPVERPSLEKAIEQVEDELLRVGRGEWRSRTLILRARLALSTGAWRGGLRLAEESLESAYRDPWKYTLSSHYWLLVLMAIWLGELDLAWRRLGEWDGLGEHRTSQRGARAWLRSCALRRAGRAEQALDHARLAYVESLREGEYPLRITAAVELVCVLLALGDLDLVREPLGQALRLRNTETSEHAYVLRILVGDHQLARARALGGLPAVDLDFQHTARRPRGRRQRDRAGARRALRHAHAAYEHAARRGEALDLLYGCRLRAWQLAHRRAALAQVEEELQ